jgi:ABC-type Zn uptake system ZnuABC Zn-binding protein ZnuA
MRKLLAILAIGALLALAGCAEDTQPNETDSSATTNGTVVYEDVPVSDDVTRFIDKEAGTVCYVYSGGGGYDGQGGLSCMPIEDTELSEQ